MEVRVQAKIWLDINGDVAFCHGKARLLAAIRERGSIRQAARALGMSYRRAWEYLRDLERAMGTSVVATQVGGAGGGGAELTEAGTALLGRYEGAMRAVSGALGQNVVTV